MCIEKSEATLRAITDRLPTTLSPRAVHDVVENTTQLLSHLESVGQLATHLPAPGEDGGLAVSVSQLLVQLSRGAKTIVSITDRITLFDVSGTIGSISSDDHFEVMSTFEQMTAAFGGLLSCASRADSRPDPPPGPAAVPSPPSPLPVPAAVAEVTEDPAPQTLQEPESPPPAAVPSLCAEMASRPGPDAGGNATGTESPSRDVSQRQASRRRVVTAPTDDEGLVQFARKASRRRVQSAASSTLRVGLARPEFDYKVIQRPRATRTGEAGLLGLANPAQRHTAYMEDLCSYLFDAPVNEDRVAALMMDDYDETEEDPSAGPPPEEDDHYMVVRTEAAHRRHRRHQRTVAPKLLSTGPDATRLGAVAEEEDSGADTLAAGATHRAESDPGEPSGDEERVVDPLRSLAAASSALAEEEDEDDDDDDDDDDDEVAKAEEDPESSASDLESPPGGRVEPPSHPSPAPSPGADRGGMAADTGALNPEAGEDVYLSVSSAQSGASPLPSPHEDEADLYLSVSSAQRREQADRAPPSSPARPSRIPSRREREPELAPQSRVVAAPADSHGQAGSASRPDPPGADSPGATQRRFSDPSPASKPSSVVRRPRNVSEPPLTLATQILWDDTDRRIRAGRLSARAGSVVRWWVGVAAHRSLALPRYPGGSGTVPSDGAR